MAGRIGPRTFLINCIVIAALVVVVAGSAWFDFSIKEFILQILKNYHLIRPEEDPVRMAVVLARTDNSPEPTVTEYPRIHYERFAKHVMPARISPEVLRASQDILDVYMTTAGTHPANTTREQAVLEQLQRNEKVTEAEWQEVKNNLQRLNPLTATLRRTSAFNHLRPDQMPTSENFEKAREEIGAAVVETGVRAFCLRAFDEQKKGRDRDSLENVSNAADLLWTEAVGSINLQRAQNQGIDTVAATWGRIAQNQKNALALDTSLQRMNKTVSRIRNASSEVYEPLSRHLLSRIRATGQADIVNKIERTTPDYLLDIYNTAWKQKIEKARQEKTWTPEQIQTAQRAFDEETKNIQEKVTDYMTQQANWAKTADEPTSMMLTLPKAQELTSLVRLDLTRVEVARKVAAGLSPDLDASKDLTALSPRYILPPPSDPFTKDTYPIDPETGNVYSLGPDGIDQKGRLPYDPTNGATSYGDITIPWNRQKAGDTPTNP